MDYELRRELLRANKTGGIARLEIVTAEAEYLALTTTAMRQAAAFWAEARQQGQPTAADKTIDGDVILAAQAATLGEPDAIIATTNVGHPCPLRCCRPVAKHFGRRIRAAQRGPAKDVAQRVVRPGAPVLP